MYIDNWVSGVQTPQQEGVGMKVTDERIVRHGQDSAVYIMRDELTSPGQTAAAHLRVVSVFSKLNGRWQMIFS